MRGGGLLAKSKMQGVESQIYYNMCFINYLRLIMSAFPGQQ
jgi:hypothetical protein